MGMHFDPFRNNGGDEDLWKSAANIVKSARSFSKRMLDVNDAKMRKEYTMPLDPESTTGIRMLSIAGGFGLMHTMVSQTCDMLDKMLASRDPDALRMVALLVDSSWEEAKLDSMLPPDYIRNKAKE